MRLAFGIAVFMLSLSALAAADFDLKLERGPHAVYINWNLVDSLAEMYEAAGDKPRAVKNYRRSLELNAGNQNATEHLKVLEPQS